ncbi:MAG: family 10 glycosylhydrolase [bacterium]|nr:family 10 glycosylhydrolase [bacterium]
MRVGRCVCVIASLGAFALFGWAEDGDIEAAHEAAQAKPRRIIFNNDGDDVAFKAEAATPDGLWAVRGARVVDSQTDAMAYCVNIALGMFRLDCPLGDTLTRTVTDEQRNIVAELRDQGTDGLRVMTERCHAADIEIHVSFRMNDIHDGVKPEWGEVFLPTLKKEHPEWLHGTADEKPKHGYWSGLDYGRPEVRDYVVRMVRHFVESYDVDGVELDFWRHPPHFTTCAWGEMATDEQRAMMTTMMRRIREDVLRVERERNRPLLLGVRILESVPICRDQGLDLPKWLEEDLVDWFATGEFTQEAWPDLIALGHRHGVPVYAGLRRNLRPEDGYLESLRGQALVAHKLGADGVYFFNIFPEWVEETYQSQEPFFMWGEVECLERLDKVYSFSRPDGLLRSYLGPAAKHLRTRSIGKAPALIVAPDATVTLPLYVGDALETPRPTARVRVTFADKVEPVALDVALNGVACVASPDAVALPRRLYDCPVDAARSGDNTVELTNTGSEAVRLLDLRLNLDYE